MEKKTPSTPRWRGTAAVIAAGLVVTAAAGTAINRKQAAAEMARRRAAAQVAVLASVNGDLIRQSDVARLSPTMAADQVLGVVVDFDLLDQAAAAHGIVISDSEMQRRRRNVIASEHAQTYAEAATAVQRTPTGLDLQLRHSAILERLAAAQVPAMPKDEMHARGLLIRPGGRHAATASAAHALAGSLQRQVNAGAALAPLVSRYSDDKLSRSHGGDMGVVQNLMMSPDAFGPDRSAYQALLGAVKTGRVAGPIKGDRGYWVVQVVSTGRRPGPDAARYAALADGWRGYWMQKLEPAVMSRLRGQAVIEPPLQMSFVPSRGQAGP